MWSGLNRCQEAGIAGRVPAGAEAASAQRAQRGSSWERACVLGGPWGAPALTPPGSLG